MWQRNKALNFHDLFKDMPPSLQSDVSLALYKDAIDKVHACTCSPSVIVKCCRCLYFIILVLGLLNYLLSP